jgi:FHA domain
MNVFAIELADRAVSLARGGRVLTSAPSAVFDDATGELTGSNGWRELRSRPRAISTRHLSAVLTQRASSARAEALLEAELKSRLAEQPWAEGERIWIVTPAQAEVAGSTALLGITRRMGLPVDGFVDPAAVTSAALGYERSTVVLELGLHHAAATAVDCEGSQARRRRTVLSDRGGLIELYQVWLDLVSTTMVKRTRFDPLHDAATEQQLFAAIPALALEAAQTGNTTASVTTATRATSATSTAFPGGATSASGLTNGTERFEAALTRDQFSQAAESIYHSMVGLLHQLRPAGAPVCIVVPHLVAQLPGLREQLDRFVGCDWVSVPDGFAAAATSLLDLPESQMDGDSVRLLRRLPLGAQLGLADSVTREPLGQSRSGGPPPSHVLWDGRAYSLNVDSLVVGRGPSDSSRHITLPDGLAGVSRRHCTFVHDGDELVLLDHSTFGTYVNGERVQERVRIHAGDRVRLGEPGVELALIAVGEVAAATQQP